MLWIFEMESGSMMTFSLSDHGTQSGLVCKLEGVVVENMDFIEILLSSGYNVEVRLI